MIEAPPLSGFIGAAMVSFRGPAATNVSQLSTDSAVSLRRATIKRELAAQLQQHVHDIKAILGGNARNGARVQAIQKMLNRRLEAVGMALRGCQGPSQNFGV